MSENDILEAFGNRTGIYLEDTREDNASDPVTLWFIAENDYGLRIKVCFIRRDDTFHIRTAYKPNEEEERIYKKYGG